MKPKRVILIRHGESEANVDREILIEKPDYACELTKLGWTQAELAGKQIKEIVGDSPCYFYCSPYWRTRQTFIGLRKNLKVFKYREDPRIREQERATSLGNLIEPQERDTYGHFYYRFNGGESCADTFDRVSDFLSTLYRDFEDEDYPENCVIVNHGMTLRLILMRWLKLTVEEFELLKNPPNCSFFVLELENGKYKLKTEFPKYSEYRHNYQFDWSKYGI